MYEALVARVRYHIQKANFMGLKEAESTLLLGEAADAIEELDTLLDGVSADNEALCETIEKLKNPRWIPVEERVPQGGDESGQLCENVILMLSVEYNEAYVTCGWINGVTKKAYYLDEIDDFIHKTDISDVKAWMPLPEPPKEET